MSTMADILGQLVPARFQSLTIKHKGNENLFEAFDLIRLKVEITRTDYVTMSIFLYDIGGLLKDLGTVTDADKPYSTGSYINAVDSNKLNQSSWNVMVYLKNASLNKTYTYVEATKLANKRADVFASRSVVLQLLLRFAHPQTPVGLVFMQRLLPQLLNLKALPNDDPSLSSNTYRNAWKGVVRVPIEHIRDSSKDDACNVIERVYCDVREKFVYRTRNGDYYLPREELDASAVEAFECLIMQKDRLFFFKDGIESEAKKLLKLLINLWKKVDKEEEEKEEEEEQEDDTISNAKSLIRVLKSYHLQRTKKVKVNGKSEELYLGPLGWRNRTIGALSFSKYWVDSLERRVDPLVLAANTNSLKVDKEPFYFSVYFFLALRFIPEEVVGDFSSDPFAAVDRVADYCDQGPKMSLIKVASSKKKRKKNNEKKKQKNTSKKKKKTQDVGDEDSDDDDDDDDDSDDNDDDLDDDGADDDDDDDEEKEIVFEKKNSNNDTDDDNDDDNVLYMHGLGSIPSLRTNTTPTTTTTTTTAAAAAASSSSSSTRFPRQFPSSPVKTYSSKKSNQIKKK